jgi:hypothetical protein
MIYYKGINFWKKKLYVSWWMQISQYDSNIAFKLHNFVQAKLFAINVTTFATPSFT